MACGYHSKNATFSILTGALLYYVRLCQKGRDKLIGRALPRYIKAAEGYGARLALKKAKDEGLRIEVHWQDADSSSSKVVAEHFGDANVMLCGGHTGRAHKKQLKSLAKIKSFSEEFKALHRDRFPQVCHIECHRDTVLAVGVCQKPS